MANKKNPRTQPYPGKNILQHAGMVYSKYFSDNLRFEPLSDGDYVVFETKTKNHHIDIFKSGLIKIEHVEAMGSFIISPKELSDLIVALLKKINE